MGHVFDVSEGADFYGKASSYGAFAGRDASVCFCTGVFTKEEAEKGTELIPLNQLPGLHEWLEFYKKHDKYSFIGHLVDPRYFDENGAQTKRMKGLYERLETILAEQEAKKKKRIKSWSNMRWHEGV